MSDELLLELVVLKLNMPCKS